MGSKLKPGKFDCYANAEPDEEMFILLARDRLASPLTSLWALIRAGARAEAELTFSEMMREHSAGYVLNPDSDKAVKATECAFAMAEWRTANRKPRPMTAAVTPGRDELLALAEWCRTEREKLGAIDGYDYRSGEEFGLRRAQSEIESRLAAKPAEEGVREATIEQCRKIAFNIAFAARNAVRAAKGRTERLQALASEETAQQISKAIAALSTTGEPKR